MTQFEFKAVVELDTEYFIKLLTSTGGLGVFVGVILESIFAPIPSPLIPLAAGALLIPDEATLPEAVFQSLQLIGLWGAFGATLGAVFSYAIAYYGGRPLIEKYGKYFGFSWKDVEKINEKFMGKSYDEVVFFLCRLIPIIPLSPVSILFGIVRFNPIKFLILTFIGTFPRYVILGVAGWYFKSAYTQLANIIGFYETIFTILIAGLIVILVLAYRRRRKQA